MDTSRRFCRHLTAEELAACSAERAYEEEQDEAQEMYQEWHGYYDGEDLLFHRPLFGYFLL